MNWEDYDNYKPDEDAGGGRHAENPLAGIPDFNPTDVGVGALLLYLPLPDAVVQAPGMTIAVED